MDNCIDFMLHTLLSHICLRKLIIENRMWYSTIIDTRPIARIGISDILAKEGQSNKQAKPSSIGLLKGLLLNYTILIFRFDFGELIARKTVLSARKCHQNTRDRPDRVELCWIRLAWTFLANKKLHRKHSETKVKNNKWISCDFRQQMNRLTILVAVFPLMVFP